MIGTLTFFVFLQLLTVWYFISRPSPKPVVIGVPDAENKTMSWMARPEKTKWDKFKEGIHFLSWGILLGGVGMFLMML